MIENKRTQKAETLVELVNEVFRLNTLIQVNGDGMVHPLGLTSALWHVLAAVREAPLHMSQIARNRGLTRQSVRRNAKILEKKGFIEFIDNPDHKRANLASLTPKGREILKKVEEVETLMSNETEKHFKIHELKDAIHVLKRFSEHLETLIQGE